MKIQKTSMLVALLSIVSIFPLIDLLHPGSPAGHDMQDHVARIANFYANLSEGNLVPRWAGNLNWGYGHPILMFLYPLSSYIASFFHLLGFSLVDSVKLVFAIAFIGSGAAMFLWAKTFLGDTAAFVSGILYLFAPYRFVDMYVRGAIGEHVAFAFMPLTLFFVYKLWKQYSPWYLLGGCLSFAGLILSHNAISLMFVPLLMLYIFCLWLTSKKPKISLIRIIFSLCIGIGLSAFFWFPAFVEGKYTLRDIVTAGEYATRFVTFGQLLYGPWSYGGTGEFTVQVGILNWFLIFAGIVITYFQARARKIEAVFSLGILGIFLGSLFLMTGDSNFIWQTITTLQKFQFPWRFLTIAVFTSSILGGVVVSKLPRKYNFIILIAVVVVSFIFTANYWHAKAYIQKPEDFYTRVYDGTTDTGESAPIWSIRFMGERPGQPIDVVDGESVVKLRERTIINRSYDISVITERARLSENTLYFPGWHVYVDGVEVETNFQDPAHRGLMTFYVNKGEHIVSVVFKETKLRHVANTVSLLSAFGLLAILVSMRYTRFGKNLM